MDVILAIHRAGGTVNHVPLTCRIDTLDEVEYYRNGGILQYVLRNMMPRLEAFPVKHRLTLDARQ